MCLLFETVRVLDGVPQNLPWHEARINRSRLEMWNLKESVILQPLMVIPQEFTTGTVRCKIIYGPGIRQIEFSSYKKEVIRSLKLVSADSIDYHLKFFDRSAVDSLVKFRGNCDEILIVKNGLVTDTSMSNIIFLDGADWVTPAEPLLRGTCRERLIAGALLHEREIRPGDIRRFAGCKLVNAMRSPDEEMVIPVSQIFQ